MKVTLLVDLVSETHEGEAEDVYEIISQLMEDGDDVKIVSVEMTPQEQIEAVDAIASTWGII